MRTQIKKRDPEGVIHCPKCGTKNHASAKKCGKCGLNFKAYNAKQKKDEGGNNHFMQSQGGPQLRVPEQEYGDDDEPEEEIEEEASPARHLSDKGQSEGPIKDVGQNEKCPRCEADIKPGLKRCPRCGIKLNKKEK